MTAEVSTAAPVRVGPDDPGGIIVALKGSEVVFETVFGLALPDSRVAWTMRTPGHVGSLTKQFTAVLLWRLHERKVLDLDEPLHRWLPELPTYAAQVTLRHCLSNVSGLRHDEGLAWFAGRDWRTPTSLDWLYRAVARQPAAQAAPGSVYLYNDTGFRLAARVAERATQRPAAELFERYVFVPAGMSRSRLEGRGAVLMPQKAAVFYRGLDGRPWRHTPYMELSGDGGAVSTGEDLVAWARYLRASGLASVLGGGGALAGGNAGGYGFGSYVGVHRGQRWIGHSGGGVGVSVVMVFPDDDLAIVHLGNHTGLEPRPLALSVADRWLSPTAPLGPTIASRGLPLRSYADQRTGLICEVGLSDSLGRAVVHGNAAALVREGERYVGREGACSISIAARTHGVLAIEVMGISGRFQPVDWSPLTVAAAPDMVGRYSCTDTDAAIDLVAERDRIVARVAGGPDLDWQWPVEKCALGGVYRAGDISFRRAGDQIEVSGANLVALPYRQARTAI